MTAPVRSTQLQNLAAGQPAEDDRLGRSFFTPGAGLHSRTGIWPAPAGYTGEVTLLSNTQLRVNPFRGTIAGTQSGVQGDYTVTSDAVRTLTIGGSHATLTRIDLVVSRVRDTGYTPNEGANDFVPPSIVPGAPLASPAAPATPVNALVHGTVTVPPAGAPVTFTPGNPGYTVALGGIRPAVTADTANGAYTGAYRDHPTSRLQRWDGAGWAYPLPDTGWLPAPAVGGILGIGPGGNVYRVKGGWCAIRSHITVAGTSQIGNSQGIYQLPPEARPSYGIDGPLAFAYGGTGGGLPLETVIGADGVLSVNGRNLTFDGFQIYATFPVS